MPELPEVETIVAGLRLELPGRRIEAVRVRRGDRLFPSATLLATGLTGRTFLAARRHGKAFFLDLDGGLTLAGHLRMTGQLRLHQPDDEEAKHTHLLIGLDDGRELRWRDVRRFGWLHLVPTGEESGLPEVAGMGPDALTLSEADFVTSVRGSGRMLKALLLAQDRVAGLGNIYADEVLHRAGIHPTQAGNELTAARARSLFAAMRAVLAEALALRGSSIDGEYVGLDGFPGDFQGSHRVYGRAGQACLVCGRPIERIVVNSRSTCFCPKCQPKRTGRS